MSGAKIQRIEEIFVEALELEDTDERRDFLDHACGGDLMMRAAVEEKLSFQPVVDNFFSGIGSDQGFSAEDVRELTRTLEPGEEVAGETSTDEFVGTCIGPYKLLQKIGEGGCGVVYMAEQEKPVRRRVAFKIIKLGMDTKNVIARFEAERQALALMDHPSIARVLDAGATETGRPYFVMELVRGVKITTYCDANNLNAHKRLELFTKVCQAIQHAHQKGIIHRDIKPSNTLVTIIDGVPVPKVIDFGIAKAIEGRLTDNTIFTAFEQFIGTPAYMSPEQAVLSGVDVDTRSDIYSLGVLLYELLTGKTPFDQKKLVDSGFDEMRRTLRDDEPQRPSTMVTSLRNTELTNTATRRHVEPPQLISLLKGDLDWIIMKALEKDRRRRYETATGLAADVQRYMNNEAVVARPPSRIYRFQKLVQRNKIIFVSGTVVALTLVAGMTVSSWLFLQERESRIVQLRLLNEAETARADAERIRANEMQLRREAEARERVTEATVMVSHNRMQEADALLEQVPADLFTPSTEAMKLFRTIGQWNILNSRWKAAADRYMVLVKVNQVDKSDRTDAATRDLLVAAPLLIESGDIDGYDHFRRTALAQMADTLNPIAAEHLIKVSVLLPPDQSILRQLEPLAHVVSESLASQDSKINGGPFYGSWRAMALGMLEYRRGDPAKAEDWFNKSLDYGDPMQSHIIITQIFLGMIHRQLGQAEKGEMELQKARETVANYFLTSQKKPVLADARMGQLQDWLIARQLLNEENPATNPVPMP